MVLVQLRKDGRNLALAEGVVQRLVDGRGSNAEAIRRLAVENQFCPQAQVLLVACHVAQFRPFLQLGDHLRGEVIQFLRIGIFERVLELGAAYPVLHRQVLHRLHEQGDAGNPGQCRLQAANHVAGADLSLLERLQVDENAPAIHRCVRAIDADERGEAVDGGVFQDDLCQFLLLPRHLLKG